MSKQTTASSRTLHDRIFKEFLHRFFREFLELFFPDEAAHLNFETLTFLDQELVINLPNQTLRITDVVAEVETLSGEGEVILVHIEVEAGRKRSLPQRVFEYYALLRLLRQKRVLPLALVLQPQAGGLTRQQYTETLFGQELVRFSYGQVGLRDLPSEAYLARGEPVAAALAALMKPEAESKAAVKLAGLRTVIESGLSLGDKRFLVDVIETYLPQAEIVLEGGELMDAIAETELLWSERIEREGELRGQLQGQRKLLMHQLETKFGELPPEFVTRIKAIEDETLLEALSEQVLTAATLADMVLPEAKDDPSGEQTAPNDG